MGSAAGSGSSPSCPGSYGQSVIRFVVFVVLWSCRGALGRRRGVGRGGASSSSPPSLLRHRLVVRSRHPCARARDATRRHDVRGGDDRDLDRDRDVRRSRTDGAVWSLGGSLSRPSSPHATPVLSVFISAFAPGPNPSPLSSVVSRGLA